MCAVQDHPSLEGIESGSYKRGVSGPLRMGALGGNHFQIVIRDIQCNTDQRLVNESDIKPAVLKQTLQDLILKHVIKVIKGFFPFSVATERIFPN